MDDSLVPEAGGAEDLLAAPPVAAADQLRKALWRQTTGVLRRRRWRRRVGLAAALAACYGAGLLTMKWLPGPPAVGPGHGAGAGAVPAGPGVAGDRQQGEAARSVPRGRRPLPGRGRRRAVGD